MQIRPIQSLRVFDTIRDPKFGTHLSADIDGQVVYSLFVKHRDKLSSGTNTAGAFRDETPGSILAWLDPVSGVLIRTNRLKASATVQALPLLLSALAAIVLHHFGMLHFHWLIPVSVMSLLAVVMISIAIRHKANKTLAQRLRAQLGR